jgi:hypothetical protein
VGHHPTALEIVRHLITFPLTVFDGRTILGDTFLPPNTNIPEAAQHNKAWILSTLNGYGAALALPAVLYWLLPFGDRLTRTISLAFAAGQFYLAHIAYYPCPWYLPLPSLLGTVVLSQILDQLLRIAGDIGSRGQPALRKQITVFALTAAIAALTFHTFLTLGTAWQLRNQQLLIETGHRREIGLWLKQQAESPKETVFLEPLGYIGYFSGLKMYDFPGLSSPEMIETIGKLGKYDWPLLIRDLRPDWLVLREGEVDYVSESDSTLIADHYQEVRRFDATAQINAVPWLLGRGYLMHDAVFVVFQRK